MPGISVISLMIDLCKSASAYMHELDNDYHLEASLMVTGPDGACYSNVMKLYKTI